MFAISINVPDQFEAQAFHDFAHEIAKTVPTRNGLSQYDIGQNIKELIIDRLSAEYVQVTKYQGWERLRASGTHRFLKPVPQQVMLEATRRAGIECAMVGSSVLA